MAKQYLNNDGRLLSLNYWLKMFVLTSVIFSCAPKPEKITLAELVPNNWKPSLEQVQSDLQEAFDTNPNKSQRILNRGSQNIADLADARLFIAYVTIMNSLDEIGRANLLKEQKEWLAKRAEAAEAGVTSKGGSLGPLEYSGAYRKITEERLAELGKRLAQQKKK